MKTTQNFPILQILSATIKNRPKRREASNRNAVADEVRKRKEQQMKHTITLQFNTDSPLNEAQMNNLISMLALQLEEPQDLEGNKEDWTAQEISFGKTDRQAGRFIAR
jgi:hypothetical protein